MNPAASAGRDDVEDRLRHEVLPLFRTRAELHRWYAVREYVRGAQEGIEQLHERAREVGAAPVIPYVQKAIASTVRVILRANDSTGAIGDTVHSLLALHARLCAAGSPPPVKLVRWLMTFQFGGTQDFFEIDIIDYADALGPKGMAQYRAELARLREITPPEPSEADQQADWRTRMEEPERFKRQTNDRHTRFLLDYNAKRLAVLDRDVDGVIAAYGGDQTRSYRLHDASKALVEIGEVHRAIEFAERAAFLERHHQAEQAAHYWCDLLRQYRPREESAARRAVFERWPSSGNASRLRDAAAGEWAAIENGVLADLAARPYDYIVFLLLTLNDVPRAWSEAQRVDETGEALGDDLWTRLVEAIQQVDPSAVIPVLHRLIESDLRVADAGNYRSAVKRLRQLRTISAGIGETDDARAFTAQLRERHRNRPRFLQELGRANLL